MNKCLNNQPNNKFITKKSIDSIKTNTLGRQRNHSNINTE